MASSVIRNFFRTTGGMFLDGLNFFQPKDTYRTMFAGAIDESTSFSAYNEFSNKHEFDFGGEARGFVYVQEKKKFAAFILGYDGIPFVGWYDPFRKEFKKIFTDPSNKTGICANRWTHIEYKNMQPCNHTNLYWANGDTAKTIDLDDPCCNYDDLTLIDCSCVIVSKAEVIEKGGVLPNGVYWVSARLQDADGNESNFAYISEPKFVAQGDYVEGEEGTGALSIKIKTGGKGYTLCDIAIISKNPTYSISLINNITYNAHEINFTYTGHEQSTPIDLSYIKTRHPRFFKTNRVAQHNGELILYQNKLTYNHDLQREVNKVKVYAGLYAVPISQAHKFNGLRSNEIYCFSLNVNFCDNTTTEAYVLSNHNIAGTNIVTRDCDGCEVPEFRVKDTSELVERYTVDDHTASLEARAYSEVTEQPKEDTPYSVATWGDRQGKAFKPSELPTAEGIDLFGIVSKETLQLFACMCSKITALKNRLGIVFDEETGEYTINCNDCDTMLGQTVLNAFICFCQENDIEIEGGILSPDWEQNGNTFTGRGCNNGAQYTLNQSETFTGGLIQRMWKLYFSGVQNMHNWLFARVDSQTCNNGSKTGCYSQTNDIATGSSCGGGNVEYSCGGVVYVCSGGKIYVKQITTKYPQRYKYLRLSKYRALSRGAKDNYSIKNAQKVGQNDCDVTEFKPRLVAKYKFGYHENEDTYPLTKNCNCEYVYGDLAGLKQRLFRVPSNTKAGCYISHSDGVPNSYDHINDENRDAFVFMWGLIIEDLPDLTKFEFNKPLCAERPITINMVERTDGNKSVLGTAVGHSCFKGEIQGEPVLFSKHAVNSFERYDRSIEPLGKSTFRGGVGLYQPTEYDPNPVEVSPYFLHSPDLHLLNPSLGGKLFGLLELESYGTGYRYGLSAKDDKPESITSWRKNNLGARQSINLNHYVKPKGVEDDSPILRCVNAIEPVKSHSNLHKLDKFAYNYCNRFRESGVLVELSGKYVEFKDGDGCMENLYGGALQNGDNASDRSFTGDTFIQEMPIHDARAHQITIIRYLPHQYGSCINRTYVSLGLHTESITQRSVQGLVGDSFVNSFTYKRTGYISDKTNKKITKFHRGGFGRGLEVEGDSGGIGTGFLKVLNDLFGSMLDAIFESIGWDECGYLPESGESGDFINIFGGLRYHKSEIGGTVLEENQGETKACNVPKPMVVHTPVRTDEELGSNDFRDVNAGDNYFYHLLKTSIHTILPSDVNTKYRQTGDEEMGKVHLFRLKRLHRDSKFPFEWHYSKAWLTRTFIFWEENSTLKRFFRMILNFLWTYGVGIYIIIQGILVVVDAFNTGSGNNAFGVVALILAIFEALLGTAIIVLGVFWISSWISSTQDNQMIDSLLNIANGRPDIKNQDGTFSTEDGKIRQFEDNYFRYNHDYSMITNHEVVYGIPDPYITCKCDDEPSNDWVSSNQQNPSSHIDAWKNFKMNSRYKLPSNLGNIKKIFSMTGRLYVHTTKYLIAVQYNKDESMASFLTQNEGVLEGYGGLEDPNASLITPYGYVYPSRTNRKIFIFNGSGSEAITDNGVIEIFDEWFNFKLEEEYPDFANIDNKASNGIGYNLGFDYKKNILFISKNDYLPKFDKGELTLENNVFKDKNGQIIPLSNKDYFLDISYTMSYNLKNKIWVGFTFHKPILYASDGFDLFSISETGFYRHNDLTSHGVFYGKEYPFIFNTILLVPNEETVKTIQIDVTTQLYENNRHRHTSHVLPNFVMFYNSYSSTGILSVIDKNSLVGSQKNQNPDRDKILCTVRGHTLLFDDISNRLIDADSSQTGEDIFFNKIYDNDIFNTIQSNYTNFINNQNVAEQYFNDRYIGVILFYTDYDRAKRIVINGASYN